MLARCRSRAARAIEGHRRLLASPPSRVWSPRAFFGLRFGVDQHGSDQRRLLALVDPCVTCPALLNDVERLEIGRAFVE
jgi:hypothetical protein